MIKLKSLLREDRAAQVKKFMAVYEPALKNAVEKYPDEYGWPVSMVPSTAQKMEKGFLAGTYNHSGRAIKDACKQLGINHTRRDMEAFFNGTTQEAKYVAQKDGSSITFDADSDTDAERQAVQMQATRPKEIDYEAQTTPAWSFLSRIKDPTKRAFAAKYLQWIRSGKKGPEPTRPEAWKDREGYNKWRTVISSLSSLSEATKWEYTDAAGRPHKGTVIKTSDRGGTDVTYFFQDEKTGEVSVLSGSRLKQAKVVHEQGVGGIAFPGAEPGTIPADYPDRKKKVANARKQADRMQTEETNVSTLKQELAKLEDELGRTPNLMIVPGTIWRREELKKKIVDLKQQIAQSSTKTEVTPPSKPPVHPSQVTSTGGKYHVTGVQPKKEATEFKPGQKVQHFSNPESIATVIRYEPDQDYPPPYLHGSWLNHSFSSGGIVVVRWPNGNTDRSFAHNWKPVGKGKSMNEASAWDQVCPKCGKKPPQELRVWSDQSKCPLCGTSYKPVKEGGPGSGPQKGGARKPIKHWPMGTPKTIAADIKKANADRKKYAKTDPRHPDYREREEFPVDSRKMGRQKFPVSKKQIGYTDESYKALRPLRKLIREELNQLLKEAETYQGVYQGFRVSYSGAPGIGGTVSVTKQGVPEGQFDDELDKAYLVLGKFKATKSGSTWGSDGMGYVVNKKSGLVNVKKSGVVVKNAKAAFAELGLSV